LPDSKPDQFIEQITSESILSDAITAKGVRESVVSILTVHSAKGREWEIVALSGLQEGVWPNYKARGTLLGSERIAEHMLTGLKSRAELEKSST
jgi:superfamily I DNA/RNA helicase